MKTSDFGYVLPPELIAQTPIEPRSASRFMVLSRADGSVRHRRFFELPDLLRAGDVLVSNDSRVIPARLNGRKIGSGGKLEILLVRRLHTAVWEALVKPANRIKIGTRIEIVNESTTGNHADCVVTAEAVGLGDNGKRILSFSDESLLPLLGQVPLPPYIHSSLSDPERYQTIYARTPGSVAAPTAGLHFTSELIEKIKDRGIHWLTVTLHVGLDTFLPVREENPLEHPIHREFGVVSQEVAGVLTRARSEGRRIICVGTTSVRLIEAAARVSCGDVMNPFSDWVDTFIVPGHCFRMVDAMITNFHLPRSTTLMLATAFAGKELIDRAYREAIAQRYRFYSFGDAMLVL